MKKILSLSTLFVMLVTGACSTSPNTETGQQVAKGLEGTWESNRIDFIFSGNTLKIETDTLTLANPDSIVLGDKTYAVYSGTRSGAAAIAVFRAEGDEFFGDHKPTLDEIKAEFVANPSTFTSPAGNRKKS